MFNQATASPTVEDSGLRSYMIGIYNKMGLGLVLTAILSWLFAYNPNLTALLYTTNPKGALTYTILGWIVAFAPLAVIFMRSFLGSTVAYWLVVVLFGISLSSVAMLYTVSSLASTFLITAAAFGGLSLFGYTTKKNLSGVGNFAVMALIGLIIAMIVNLFLRSSMFDLIISAAGVLIFSALIAYDTQNLKNLYSPGLSGKELDERTSEGALSLYLDFINLMLFLLRFLGVKKD
jgi:hypothetical protein